MPKRNDDKSPENLTKKLKFNTWKSEETLPTPPDTPNKSSNPYAFSIWKEKSNNETDEFSPIKLSELAAGICLNRPLSFRVSFKSDKRSTKNGDMFIIHAMDGKDEIQVTVFPQQTVIFFEMIQFNCTFQLTNFNVKTESSDFPLFVGNRLYVGLLNSSKMEKIDDNLVQDLDFNFQKIDRILSIENKTKCDFIGIVCYDWGIQIVGQNKKKRLLTITDESKECIGVTLWGNNCESFTGEIGACILVHNGIVGEYKDDKFITCASNTLLVVDHNLPIVNELKVWYDGALKLKNNQ